MRRNQIFRVTSGADPNYPKLLEVAANFHEALSLNQALGGMRDGLA